MDTRYAIYFVPPQASELYWLGASVLGYDCYTSEAVSFPSGAGSDWAQVVREPRRYGFHGTLKAPFRLAAGNTEDDLVSAVHAFARRQAIVAAGALRVSEVESFIALVPVRPCAALDQLAATCVRDFERFRAPMTIEERNRRLRAPLTPRQKQQLDDWGYSFVFDDFRFHMTLMGPMAQRERKAALRRLSTQFAFHRGMHELTIDRIVISRENQGLFRVIEIATLADGHAI